MKKTNLSEFDPNAIPNGNSYTIGIIAAEWNPEITNAMLQGAADTLREHGVKESNIIVRRVPGTFELSSAADMMLCRTTVDAVICIRASIAPSALDS